MGFDDNGAAPWDGPVVHRLWRIGYETRALFVKVGTYRNLEVFGEAWGTHVVGATLLVERGAAGLACSPCATAWDTRRKIKANCRLCGELRQPSQG